MRLSVFSGIILFVFSAFGHAQGAGITGMMCREAAEDPLLSIVADPHQTLRGKPKEVTICDATCSVKSERFLLNEKGLVVQRIRPVFETKYEYAKSGMFPKCAHETVFGRSSSICYQRDKFGNIEKVLNGSGIVEAVFENSVVNGQFIQNRFPGDGKSAATFVCKDGVFSKKSRFGDVAHLNLDSQSITSAQASVESNFSYEFHQNGKIEQSLETMTKNGRVEGNWMRIFNLNGQLGGEASQVGSAPTSHAAYRDYKVDEHANWISRMKCQAPGQCVEEKRKIAYWK